MISAEEILKTYWGFTEFRPLQKEIITAVLAQKNVITLLPTGGGKSICFQVPALAKEGVCLVISPLIALMQDQVENLQQKGIKAVNIPSGVTQDELITLFDNIKFGGFKCLYISPERLQSSFIQQKIKELNINLFAIDEAHCISEWGHDFRPSYRNISILKNLKPNVNFIALTATANEKVIKDIATNLDFIETKVFKKSFYRANLAYQIFKVEDKLQRLIQIFKKTKTPAIVYVNSRKNTKQIASFLNANGFKSSFYHGGLSSDEKKIAFDNWMTEVTPIIVATNAFGMGIDKANVGLVIHYNLPFSIENYVQETGRAGRAGRNNKKSFAVLLYNLQDISVFKQQTQNALPNLKEVKEIHRKLYQYFRISLGEIIEESYDFNVLEFCKKYNFPFLKTDIVLKILANNGILEMNTNYNQKSTLEFIVSSKSVINYTQKNAALKNFINAVLRTYGGLFEQESKINEFIIAKKAGLTSQQVITNLKQLQTDGIINYKPKNSNTSITFLVPREDDKSINKFTKEIEKILHQKNKKAKDLVHFISNDNICRSKQVLSYFDEYSSKNCGICDVCIAQKKTTTINLSAEITQLLKHHKSLSSSEINTHISANEKDILIHLRSLLRADKIIINNQNKYQLNR